MKYIFLFLLALTFSSCSRTSLVENKFSVGDKSSITSTIVELMQEQQDCWNKGDVECFMKHYLKSDELMFVGKNLTYGWQNTLDNYKKGYPDAQAMGQLTFNNIRIEPLDENYCFVVGEWNLDRKEMENLGGHYSLLWKKTDQNKWVIIVDHSS